MNCNIIGSGKPRLGIQFFQETKKDFYIILYYNTFTYMFVFLMSVGPSSSKPSKEVPVPLHTGNYLSFSQDWEHPNNHNPIFCSAQIYN